MARERSGWNFPRYYPEKRRYYPEVGRNYPEDCPEVGRDYPEIHPRPDRGLPPGRARAHPDGAWERVGLSPDGVKYHLQNLKAAGVIRRGGSDRAGHWEVLR